MGQNHGVLSTSSNSRCSDPKMPTPGRSIAGVDGCRRGWVMIWRDENGWFGKRVVEELEDLPSVDIALPASVRSF